MGRADFPDSAHICIIQEFLGMSIRPAQNKLVLQVASVQTLFKFLSLLLFVGCLFFLP